MSQQYEILRVTADNASEYTLEGTNSWILGRRGSADAILIDPGPDTPLHMDAIDAALGEHGMRLADVVLTHAHDDHLGNLWRTVLRHPDVRVHDLFTGYPEELVASWGTLRIIATPGHTHDSVSIWDPETGALFSGDTVLGDGPTMIDYPDGSVGDYLESLRVLLDLPGVTGLYPGHGRVREDATAAIAWNLEHRSNRVAMIEPFIAQFDGDAVRIAEHCYPTLSPDLFAGALQNTRAALDYLLSRRESASTTAAEAHPSSTGAS